MAAAQVEISAASGVAEATPVARRRRRKIALLPVLATLLLLAFVLGALCANFITPHDAIEGTLLDRLKPPLTSGYFLGTDVQGRDILTRVIYGARVSLSVAVITVLISASLGSLIGLYSGFHGSWIDGLIMRAVDSVLGFPLIMLALLFSISLGPGFATVVLSISLVAWASYARVVRGEALTLRQREFITSARVVGCSNHRIVFRYLLPNVAPTIFVLATMQIGGVILVEAGLSFIGAGIPAPTPDWGGMVSGGRDYISTAWWISLWPGLAIVLVVLAVNTLGDWLREVLDPRLRQI
ncbi:MAG: ABC transporter permease [Chloroflexi bacterium]|nr:ABC transporter permease [Chloroflexota bacterium]MBV9894706.1 ABC transporter permease [Chloroflexota bacterium]